MEQVTYFGQGQTPRHYELRAMKIDAQHREDEAGRMQTRWFDYSAMHPAEATYLYAELYKQQTRFFAECYTDIHSADSARAFTPEDIFMSRDATAMWLARSAADALGVPYEFALQFSMQRSLNRLFQHLARPNQLYGEEFEIDLAAAWAESIGHSIRYSRDERFNVAAYRGTFFQKKHVAFVIKQIQGRAAPRSGLLGRMFNEGILNQALATDHFQEEEINRALAVATTLAAQS